jgi:4-azaleucine resistance transporter AzlC
MSVDPATATVRSARAEFAGGVRAQLPLMLGVFPFGMAYGAYAVDSGLSAALSQAMSVIVFGGASQFVGVQLMASGVPGAIIVLTTLLVNLRHLLYSASLSPYVAHLPQRWRWLLGYLLTDEAYAVGITRYRRGDGSPLRHWYLLGTALTLWVGWQISTAIGILAGATAGESWSLDFALPLTFIALVVPALDGRPALAAAAVAGAIAVAGHDWPYSTGLMTAAVAGVAVGTLVHRTSGDHEGHAGGTEAT